MKVELKADERGGCEAVVSGCGVGGHTVTFRFEAPEYQPGAIQFDGDSVSYARDVLHGSVIVAVDDGEAGELRATLEAYSPDSDRPRRAARAAKKDVDHPDDVPAGAVTAAEKDDE